MVSSQTLLALMVFAMLLGTAGLHWDSWWHVALGRDSIFIPPHFLIAAMFTALAVCTILLLSRTDISSRRHLKLYLILLGVGLIFLPLDELWHRTFGYENLSTPLAAWSPPHLLLSFLPSLVASIIFFRIVRRELANDTALPIFSGLLAGVILSRVYMVLSPFTILGPWAVVGVWGEGFVMVGMALVLLTLTRIYQRQGVGVVATMVFLLMLSIAFPKAHGANIIIREFPPIPFWGVVLAYLFGIVIVEFLVSPTKNNLVRGGIFGAAVSAVLYVALYFFGRKLMPIEWWQVVLAVPVASIGGVAGGFLAKRCYRFVAAPLEAGASAVSISGSQSFWHMENEALRAHGRGIPSELRAERNPPKQKVDSHSAVGRRERSSAKVDKKTRSRRERRSKG